MSKIDKEEVLKSIDELLAFSKDKRVRNFTETIEMQVTLKNYDPNKDKRFSESVRLPFPIRPKVRVCVIGDVETVEQVKAANIEGVDVINMDNLKFFNKDQKKIKKWANKFHGFLSNAKHLRNIPRVLGPTLHKVDKAPIAIKPGEDPVEKVKEFGALCSFKLKKTVNLNLPFAYVGLDKEEVFENLSVSLNFLATLLKKNWQNIKTVYIKSTMGPSFRIY